MPFVGVKGSGNGSNTGSVGPLVNYLDKENQEKALADWELFFDKNLKPVNRKIVIDSIDRNKRKLGKKDAKFFMLTINPSQKELAFIDNDPGKLKAYTQMVMEIYARNFNKGLVNQNLLWFGKIEYKRTYKGTDKAVESGEVKSGSLKPGLQTHVHVIVSRKCADDRIKLSPLSNHRNTNKGPISGGFDRVRFKKLCEACFDEMFGYERALLDRFEVRNKLDKASWSERREIMTAISDNSLGAVVSNGQAMLYDLFDIPMPTETPEELNRKKRKNRGMRR